MFYWEPLYKLSIVAFMLQQQNGVVETETIWPAKSEYLLSGPLWKKFIDPWSTVIFHYPSGFFRAWISKLDGDILGTTTPASFLSWRMTLISAFSPRMQNHYLEGRRGSEPSVWLFPWQLLPHSPRTGSYCNCQVCQSSCTFGERWTEHRVGSLTQ